MLKKNQLALILLTLVLMLTVYYITSPFDKPADNNDDDEPTTGRIEELGELRAAIREERALQVLALDAIIADNTTTVAQKTEALENKRYLNSLTENELLLELEVINEGYRDCFVHASTNGVELTVVAEEHSLSVANEIIIMTMQKFNVEFEDVQLEFKTAEEVMGEVDS